MTALVYYTCFTSSLGGGDILIMLAVADKGQRNAKLLADCKSCPALGS